MNSTFRRRLEACGVEPKECAHHKSLKRASVLVLLWEAENEVRTLITQRSLTLRSHPGECCFPGGRRDEEDTDDIATALREAYEEVGLDPSLVTPMACLRTVESLHHLCVTPVVAWLDISKSMGKWKVNPAEVQAAFSVPLELFLKPPLSMQRVKWSGEDFVLREYHYSTEDTFACFKITGLTAHIAYEVAQIAFDFCESKPLASQVADKTVPCDSANNFDPPFLRKTGYLWKREVSSHGRTYWNRRYFVLSSSILHHYHDSNVRKQNSANKKHRLVLAGLKQTCSTFDGDKYVWVIETFGGRLVWHLAGDDPSTRDEWMACLHPATAAY